MDVSPEEFSQKSTTQRIALLSKGGAWSLIVSLMAFLVAITSVFVAYRDSFERQKLAEARAMEMQLAIAQLRDRVQLLAGTTDEIAQLAGQISDAQLRENLLQKTRQLQTQILALTDTYYKSYRPSTNDRSDLPSFPFSIISSAFAQQPSPPPPVPPSYLHMTQDDARLWVMLSVFFVLGLTFIVSILAIFRSSNPDVLKFAFDTVKTLMGFFIGVATAFLGLPSPPH
jgi:hypothetical protein